MESDNNSNEELRNRLQQVIDKSNVQKKILKKILNELNRKNGGRDDLITDPPAKKKI
jgi:hypothetical protein